MRVGDPMDEQTEVGPLAFRAHYERVIEMVDTARDEGATVADGGDRPAGLDTGFYLTPTVLTGLDDAMTVVRRANALPLGLTANIWTHDVNAALRTAQAVEAGYVYVNGSDRRNSTLPFGGWKQSGIGQENGPEELLSYTREKSITITLH